MDFEKEAREAYQIFRGGHEVGMPPHWESLTEREHSAYTIVARLSFTAGQENMRKHLAEHFHDVSDQAPKHETNLANAAKMVAVAIEQFKIPQN